MAFFGGSPAIHPPQAEFMYRSKWRLTVHGFRTGFLYLLFFSIPFSIAGGDFAIVGLYVVTGVLFAKKEIRWESLPIVKGLCLYLLGAIVGTLLSGDPLTGLPYFRSFWRLGLPFLLFFALEDEPVERYIRPMSIVSILIGLYAAVQFFTGLDVLRSEYLQNRYHTFLGIWPAVGAFSHHLTFGGVFLLLFAIFAALVLSSEVDPKWRLLYALAAMVCLSSVVFCNGRSIWLGGMTVGFVFLFVLIPVKARRAALATAVLLAIAFWLSPRYLGKTEFGKSVMGSRLLSITLPKANRDRLMMWRAGADIVRDYPIFGLGPNMSEKMEPYYRRVAEEYRHSFHHGPGTGLHNIYLQTWVDFGLLGLLGYLWLFFSAIYAIAAQVSRSAVVKSTDHALLLGIMAGLCGNMVGGFFENNFRDGEVQIAVLTLMGIAMALLKRGANR